MQYPKIATDWKKEISPPSTFTLKLTIIAPAKTEKKRKRKSDESKFNDKNTADEDAINDAHKEGSP